LVVCLSIISKVLFCFIMIAQYFGPDVGSIKKIRTGARSSFCRLKKVLVLVLVAG
jgi:hypothetical protein